MPDAVSINQRIAQQVQALRARRQLSLEALATKSGVSRSMISLIERGETSATAVVLEKLAVGLGVTLGTLFEGAAAAAPNPVSHRADRTPWRDPASGYVRCNISPAGYPSSIRITEVVLPARARVAYESGARETPLDQQIWLREGVLEVTAGGTAHRLEADDCLAMELNAPTTFHNPGRKPARYIVVIAGEPRLPAAP